MTVRKYTRLNRNPLVLALAAAMLLPAGAALAQSAEATQAQDKAEAAAGEPAKTLD